MGANALLWFQTQEGGGHRFGGKLVRMLSGADDLFCTSVMISFGKLLPEHLL